MKKILAIAISIILVVSSLAMTVSAEMITVTVPSETLVNQDFSGTLAAAPSGWTLAGTYTFDANGIRATNWSGFTLYKTEEYDAGEADYTFSATFAHNSGISYLHFGASTASNAISTSTADGYVMTIASKNNNTGVYTIYKNGREIGSLTDTNTSYGFQGNRTFTFKVTSTGITVTGAGDTFTYEDAEPITKGYVGIKLVDNNGDKGNLKAMSLVTDEYSYEMEKPAEVVTGAKVTYEKPGESYMDYDFRGASTLPSGVTPGAGYSLGTNGLTWSANPNNTSSFGTATVPADITSFTVEARYTALYSGAPKFNFLGYTLEKSGQYNVDKTFTLKKGSTQLGSSYVWPCSGHDDSSNYYSGAVLVKVTFNGNNITVNVNGRDIITDAVDTEVSKTGAVSISSGYAGSWTIGNVKITSPATNVTKTNFLMDKTFSVNDSTASLSGDGYSVSGVNEYTTGKGIVRTSAGALSAYYNGASFEGAYTLEVVAAKTMNAGTVYFNRADSSNHYSVATKSDNDSSGTLWINKTVGDAVTSLLTDDAGATVDSLSINIGTNDEMKYTITLEPMDSGDMQITVKLTNYAGAVRTYTVVDKKTETYTPFTSGKIGYANGYSGANNNRIESFKVYPTPADDASVATFNGGFMVGANAATEFAKGNTVFTFPVAMVGQNPDFIAVLYEDYEMTDIKMFDVFAVNEGLVPLFDTTRSTADNVSIVVYTWNSLEGMVPVLTTCVLD